MILQENKRRTKERCEMASIEDINLEGDRTETVLGATTSFLPAKLLPAKPDTAMVADAAAIAMDGGDCKRRGVQFAAS